MSWPPPKTYIHLPPTVQNTQQEAMQHQPLPLLAAMNTHQPLPPPAAGASLSTHQPLPQFTAASLSTTVPMWWLQRQIQSAVDKAAENERQRLQPPPPYSRDPAGPPPQKHPRCVHHEWLQEALSQAATATATLVGAASAASKVKEEAKEEVQAAQVIGDLVVGNDQSLRLKIRRLKCPDCKDYEVHSCKRC